MQFETLVFITITTFIVIFFITSDIAEGRNNRQQFVIWMPALIFTALWFFSPGIQVIEENIPDSVETSELVSIKFESEMVGEYKSSFIFGKGEYSRKEYYKVRRQIEENLYLDTVVEGEVYIRTNDKLTNTGKLEKISSCTKAITSYDIYSWRVSSTEDIKCECVKQILTVPAKSIIFKIDNI